VRKLDGKGREQAMTVALITIVLVVAGGWLLYREPPKQRPGQALSKFDRLAQRVHELIQGRWYGKVAATVSLLVVGLLAAQLFSSDPLTASTQTVTVTVKEPGSTSPQTGTTTSPQTGTTTTPDTKPTNSVLGTWTGLVIDQEDAASKNQINLTVRTTKIATETAGTLSEKPLGGDKCEYLITATGKESKAFTFAARHLPDYPGCLDEKISVERKEDGTLTYTTDLGYRGPDAGVGTLRPN
jgi:hypothetical protein